MSDTYRVSVNQAKIQLLKHSVVVQGLGLFLQLVNSQGKTPFVEWPSALDSMLALMVQESDKDLNRLARFVHGELFPSISAGLANESDEFAESKKLLPIAVIEQRISQMATRVNYGIVKDNNYTAHGSIWRWEVSDWSVLSIPEDVLTLIKSRQQERVTARQLLQVKVAQWSEDQWAAFFNAGKKRKGNLPPGLVAPQICSSPQSSIADPCSSPVSELLTNDDARVRRHNNVLFSSPMQPTGTLLSSPSSPTMRGVELSSGDMRPPMSSPTAKLTRKELQKQRRAEREMEKQRKEQERLKKEQLQPRLVNFFSPVQRKSTATLLNKEELKEHDEFLELFPPYFLRSNVVLAKYNQQQVFKVDESESTLETLEGSIPVETLREDFLRLVKGSRGRTHSQFEEREHKEPEMDGSGEEVVLSEEPSVSDLAVEAMVLDEDTDAGESGQQEVHKYRLLQFYENVRPAYWGTWSKTSEIVRPRRPFGLEETVFDYEYDSEAEWVEGEEEGEELLSEEDEDDEDEEDEEDKGRIDGMMDEDDWLVPNDYPLEEAAEAVEMTCHQKAVAVRPTASSTATGQGTARNLSDLKPHVVGVCFATSAGAGGTLKHLKAESLLPYCEFSIPIYDPRYQPANIGSSSLPSGTGAANKENLSSGSNPKSEQAAAIHKGEPNVVSSKPKKRAVITTMPFPNDHPFQQS